MLNITKSNIKNISQTLNQSRLGILEFSTAFLSNPVLLGNYDYEQ